MSPIETEQKTRPPGDGTCRRRALLVGIRTYPAIPGAYGQPLAGCHNDVANLRRALLGRGFAARDIRVLTDRLEGCNCPFCAAEPATPPPTRETILEALEELLEATAEGDVAVFYYSGHGSEVAGRGLRAGRRFQTFVPHDSGRGEAENRDIGDHEIQAWMRRMATRSAYLTMIFDCCHSGGLSDLRGEPGSAETSPRHVVPDERSDPAAYAPSLRQSIDRLEPSEVVDSRPTAGLRGDARPAAIVLSASAAKELSSETEADGLKQGLFTHHLTRILDRPPSRGETWADLFPEIAEGVTAENLAQHPRRGGNGPVFEPGPIDPDDIEPPDILELAKLAVVVGIDYRQDDTANDTRPRFSPLATPCRDAEEVARALAEAQGYEIVGLNDRDPGPLLGAKATRRRIHKMLHRLAAVKLRTRREAAVVIYFAGHGLVQTEKNGEQKGYLVPADGVRDDPSTWLAMADLRDQLVDGIRDAERLERLEQRAPLERLQCRHLLLVLDCCFGGALVYDFYRGGDEGERPIYYSEYRRFVEGTAWQLLSSASFNQQALDRDPSDPESHSPFAQALLEALTSEAADARDGGGERGAGRGDHLVTAPELHRYIDGRLKGMGVDIQTPGLSDLRPGDGQFIFTVPGYAPSPRPDPPLDPSANPWPGDEPYGAPISGTIVLPVGREHGDTLPLDDLYHGRERSTLELLAAFLATEGPLVVLGASGSGITSLLRSGLLPLLAHPGPGRQRLRSWSRREGRHELLISRQDLRSVRRWLEALELGAPLAEDDAGSEEHRASVAERVVERIVDWALEMGLLHEGERPNDSTAGGELTRRSLGVPSFDRRALDEEESGWLRRLGILALLEHPTLLVERLRLWWRRDGLADYMTVPERALPSLLGRWRLVREPAEPLTASRGETETGESVPPFLWLADSLPRALELLEPAVRDTLHERRDLRIVAGLRAADLARSPALGAWLARAEAPGSSVVLHRPAPPTGEELWSVVQGPAATRLLFFEPPALVEHLVEEAVATPAPLALLSLALHQVVVRAWNRRGASDRQLVSADLAAGGEPSEEAPTLPLATLLARRAEALHHRLGETDPTLRRTLCRTVLRAVLLDQDRPTLRPIRWRELELADPAERRRLEEQVLPALIDTRLMVADEQGLELASSGLLTTWPRLRRWLGFLARRGARWQALWQQALAWEAADFAPEKLWAGERRLARLAGSPGLNHLERAFVVTSELTGRAIADEALASRALGGLDDDWSLSAALAVELVQRARATMARIATLLAELEANRARERDASPLPGPPSEATEPAPRVSAAWTRSPAFESMLRSARQVSERGRRLAEETLRTVLAATPLSIPLQIPEQAKGRIEGLVFADRSTLCARIGGRSLAWDLDDPDKPPRQRPRAVHPVAGEGEVESRRAFVVGPEIPFPAVPPVRLPLPPRGPNAQTGHDRAIRYFAPGQLRIPPPLRPPPERLLGHRGVPTFLAFAPRERASSPLRTRTEGSERRTIPRWLASGANLEDGGAELRLWSIEADGSLASEPRSWVGPARSRGLEAPARRGFGGMDAGSVETWRAARIRRLEGTSAMLTRDGVRWWVGPVADDGSSLELRAAAEAAPRTLELPPQALGASKPTGLREVVLGPAGRSLAIVTRAGWAGLWTLPELELCWSSADRVATLEWAAIDGRRRRMAIGHLDGKVRLWWCPVETDRAHPGQDGGPVELPGRRRKDGLAVHGLAFGAGGRRLLIERRAVYEPFDRHFELHRLELEALVQLARRHAGRELDRDDLARQLPPAPHRSDLDIGEDAIDPFPDGGESKPRRKKT